MRFVVALSVMMLVISATTAQALSIHDEAPNFSVKDIYSNDVILSDLKGKIVVLEWKNHQCPFVRKHYGTGNMQKLQKYAQDNDIVWISVISSAEGKQGYVTSKEARNVVKEEASYASHVVLDASGKLGRTYGAKVTPHMYIINKDGHLAYTGAIDDISSANPADVSEASNYVMAALDALSLGKEPKVQKTQAYGCSIKYDY